jgi:CheY-like chemotaxis protein
MDINLPGIDGFAALSTLRANPQTAAIPVVAMTANATNTMITRGISQGFDAVLIKPMIVPELLTTVSHYLRPNRDQHQSYASQC